MTNQSLRALAEAEATERYGEKRRGFDLLPVDYVHGGKKDGFVEGFIAGRTSMTREKVAGEMRRRLVHMGGDWRELDSIELSEWVADAILALFVDDTQS